jgi:hypothetical protein
MRKENPEVFFKPFDETLNWKVQYAHVIAFLDVLNRDYPKHEYTKGDIDSWISENRWILDPIPEDYEWKHENKVAIERMWQSFSKGSEFLHHQGYSQCSKCQRDSRFCKHAKKRFKQNLDYMWFMYWKNKLENFY